MYQPGNATYGLEDVCMVRSLITIPRKMNMTNTIVDPNFHEVLARYVSCTRILLTLRTYTLCMHSIGMAFHSQMYMDLERKFPPTKATDPITHFSESKYVQCRASTAIPEVKEIYPRLKHICVTGDIPIECVIVAIIYIHRFIGYTKGGLQLTPDNYLLCMCACTYPYFSYLSQLFVLGGKCF